MEREMEIDLRAYLRILRKYIWIIILMPVFCMTAALVYAKYFVTPEYKATTILMVGRDYSDKQIVEYQDILIANQLINTYSQIPLSPKILEDLIQTFNLKMDAETIKKKITVNPIKNTQLIELSVTDTSPRRAAGMANHLANVTIDKITRIMPSNFIKVLDIARVPRSPCKPNLKIYIFISAILGLMLALGIVTLLGLLNRKLYSSEDVTNYLDLPTLGIIPTLKE